MIQFQLQSPSHSIPHLPEYQPEPFSKAIHDSKATYNALLGSPGLGKTITGCQEIIRFIKQGQGNGLILLPTYKMAYHVALRELRKWLPPKISLPRSPANPIIELPRQRAIFLRSAEHPESIDGLDRITFIWIDEGDLMDEEVFLRARERLRRQNGGLVDPLRMVVTATPQLRNGKSWLKTRFWEPYTQGNCNVFCVKATLWDSSRYSEADKAIIAAENPPGTWTRARYDAEWTLPPDGLVYPEIPALGKPFAQFELADADELILGLDLGYHDPLVLVILGRKGPIWTVFAEYRAQGKSEQVIARDLAALSQKLDLPRHSLPCYHDHDPNQMANIARHLANFGIHWRYRPADKDRKIISISFLRDLFIRQHLQIAQDAPSTYEELCAYAWESHQGIEQPGHRYSHGPDALRYALWTHLKGRKAHFIYRGF